MIFTDLDGTLLDRDTYSYTPVLPALELLRPKGIPLVFCSNKTRAEQETYRRALGINDPFIVENGGAIFIPHGYFPFDFKHDKDTGGYSVIELGIPYQEVRTTLEKVRSKSRVDFKGFGDMTPEEVAADTGLDLDAARRAKDREYDETLKLEGTPDETGKILNAIEKAGLIHTCGGRYYNVMGGSDKGKATEILIDLFRKKLGELNTVGIGDSFNDLPMLAAVDVPLLVQKPGGLWDNIDLLGLRQVEGIGPAGWRRTVEELLSRTYG